MKTVFLRVLEADDKASALRAVIRNPEAARDRHRYEVDSASFLSIPTSPFAYWVSERVRLLFRDLPRFEGTHSDRKATKGLATTDDVQFLRVWWEVQSGQLRDIWYSFAKGGRTSPFYMDITTYVLWHNEGARLKAFLDHKIGKAGQWSRWINATNYYGRAGITWALRASRFSPQALPMNSVFSVRGYAAFANPQDLKAMLAVFNSQVFDYLFKLALGRFGHPEFVVGVLQWLPWNEQGILTFGVQLETFASRAWSLKRNLDTRVETSHAFTLPALLQATGEMLTVRADAWTEHVQSVEAELAEIQTEIDSACFDLYGIDQADHRAVTESLVRNANIPHEPIEPDVDSDSESDDAVEADCVVDPVGLATELVAWAVGVAFGRFDVRLATGVRAIPAEPEPFDPLPVCSPAMLCGNDGVPLTNAPTGYPLVFPENGILVDDPGHPRDLTAAVRTVFDVVFVKNSDARWNEAAALVDANGHDLRAWLATDFFEHHHKRYSKSRRKAPILWQLGTASGRYSVWLYAHRLTRDSFFQIQNDVVGPKLAHEERQLTNLVQTAGNSLSAKDRKEIAAQETFVEELRGMLEEVKRVTPLWNPTLDDGVVLTMAPMWQLVPQHRPWQKELKSKWDELSAGKYDWAHLAMHLWPERVVPRCAIDRSLAIAHGLEDVFWIEGKDGKWGLLSEPTRSVEEIVTERTSPAVKAALKNLLEAPQNARTRGRGQRKEKASNAGGEV